VRRLGDFSGEMGNQSGQVRLEKGGRGGDEVKSAKRFSFQPKSLPRKKRSLNRGTQISSSAQKWRRTSEGEENHHHTRGEKEKERGAAVGRKWVERDKTTREKGSSQSNHIAHGAKQELAWSIDLRMVECKLRGRWGALY